MIPVRVLIIEDSEDAAQLLVEQLKQGGYDPVFDRVDTPQAMNAALERHVWDLVISDHKMPNFSAFGALDVLRQHELDLPFIVVSGAIDQRTAVTILKAGAHDFIPKGDYTRLLPAIAREWRQAMVRLERRQVEEALRNNEQHFRLLFEQAPVAYQALDANGNLIEVNAAWLDLMGFSREEVIGKWFGDFLVPSQTAQFLQQVPRLKVSGGLDGAEFELIRKDSSRVTVAVTTRVNYDERDTFKQTHCALHNITERKVMEEALRASQEQLNLLFEFAPDAYFMNDLEGRMIQGNRAAEEITGYKRAEFIGKSFRELGLITEAQVAQSLAALEKNRRLQPAGPDEYSLTRKDGTSVDVEVRTFPLVIKHQTVVLAIARDLTERKRAEVKIREQAALLDKAQDAILVADLADGIVYWNKSAERLYGWAAHEVIGRKAFAVLCPPGSAHHEHARREASEEGEWMGEMNHVTKRGHLVLVQSRWTLVRDAAGQPKSFLVVNTDLTEQKRLEAQFLRSQRMESLGTLASGIAHDLNNVLAPILMAVQYLRETTTDPSSQTMLATLEASARRGANIIKQVLTFARGLEGDRSVLQPKYLVKEMAKIAEETFPKSMGVQVHCEPNLWAITGDATQLHQVLLNLCINARDAMPEGGQLTIGAENTQLDEYYVQMNPEAKPGPYVVLSVKDTGQGIPPAILHKIFDPFFTTKAVGKGTGLGLATALGIVKSHGGFIHVYSELGRGAQFKVYLPATIAEPLSVAPPEPLVGLSGRGDLVLVVDDEESIRHITRKTLENNGYRVLTANDGTEALPLYVQHQREIRIAVVDMMMPFMDGVATIRALRKLDPLLPMIAASGMLIHKQETESMGATVQAFLPKPFTAEQLLRTLRDVLLNRPHAETEPERVSN